MTEKRFNFIGGYLYDGNKPIGHVEDVKFRQDYEDIVNALHEENEQLKSEIEKLSYANEDLLEEKRIWKQMSDEYTKLSDENEQLRNKKERYKRLSEIRQQQINNRILTIKEFINNCSDNKVRSVLKELFYSEVNEYDLSSENRKLLNENEKLKFELNKLEEDLDYYETKCASLETGLLQAQRDVEWLRDNTVWEQMPTNQKTYTRADLK